jgi:hypothetical protein
MDPVIRVREFLLDKVGHMTHPGNPSFDPSTQRWLAPIFCRTQRGNRVVGDVELDRDGHIVFAPSKEEMCSRLSGASDVAVSSGS